MTELLWRTPLKRGPSKNDPPMTAYDPQFVLKSGSFFEILSPFLACDNETMKYNFFLSILNIFLQKLFVNWRSNESYENCWLVFIWPLTVTGKVEHWNYLTSKLQVLVVAQQKKLQTDPSYGCTTTHFFWYVSIVSIFGEQSTLWLV